jgi:hypothetical protein
MGRTLGAPMPTTVKSLEERIDEFSADVYTRLDDLDDKLTKFVEKYDKHREEFVDFRGRAQENFTLMRWVFGFAAVITATVIGFAFTISKQLNKVEIEGQQQSIALTEIKDQLKSLNKK